MAQILPPLPPLKLQVSYFDQNGLWVPLSAGKVYSYIAGTSTPLATYQDYQLQALNANPIILDARGESPCFLLPQAYDFKVYDANNVHITDGLGITTSGSGSGTIYLNIVDTLAALQALNAGTYTYILMRGYNTKLDGCGATWIYDPASTAVRDSVFVTSPASITGSDPGRYIRIWDGEVLTPQFGGITGSGTELISQWNILNTAIASKFPHGKQLIIPAGQYAIPDNLTLANLLCEAGVQFVITTGKGLTLAQEFKAEISVSAYPLFTGAGTVTLTGHCAESYLEWYGGGTLIDSTPAFNSLLAAAFTEIKLGTAEYYLNGVVSFPTYGIITVTQQGNGFFTLTGNTTFNLGAKAVLESLNFNQQTFTFVAGSSFQFSLYTWNDCIFTGYVANGASLVSFTVGDSSTDNFNSCKFYGSHTIGGTGAGASVVTTTAGRHNFISPYVAWIGDGYAVDYGLTAAGTSFMDVVADIFPLTFSVANYQWLNTAKLTRWVYTVNGVLTIVGNLSVGGTLGVVGHVVTDLTVDGNVTATRFISNSTITAINQITSYGGDVTSGGTVGLIGRSVSRAGRGVRQFPAGGPLYKYFGSVTTSSISLTNLFLYELFADTLTEAPVDGINGGDSIIVTGGGVVDQNTTSFDLFFKLNSTDTIATFHMLTPTTATSGTANGFNFQLVITMLLNSSTVIATGTCTAWNRLPVSIIPTTVTLTTPLTSDQILQVQGQVTAGSITQKYLYVDYSPMPL